MRLRVAILMAFVFVLAAPAAHAGTVSLQHAESCECDEEGGTQQTTYALRWSGDPGEANNATVSFANGVLHLADTTATVNPGTGCVSAGPNEATCAAPVTCASGNDITCSFLFELTLDGSDGDDVLSAGAMPGSGAVAGLDTQSVTLELDGGNGNDTLNGSDQDDVMKGGAGSDTLLGNAGADVIAGDGLPVGADGESPPDAPAAPDLIDGGADNDTLSYANRAEPVFVDLRASGPAGEAG